MTKQVKKIYRFLSWLLAAVIASGTFFGCRIGSKTTKYGPPTPTETKYGPPSATGYDNRTKGNVI